MALQAENNIFNKSPKNRCRVCLKATNGKIELNQTIDYKKTGILIRELLTFCLDEQVYENGQADGLCLECMDKGIVSYEFKKQFEISQGILLEEENTSFSFVKIENFQEGSFLSEADNTVIKDEILDKEEMEQVFVQPTTTACDKPTRQSTFRGDKPTSTPCDDQQTISLGQKENQWKRKLHKLQHTQTGKASDHNTESSTSLVQHMRNALKQQISKDTQLPATETDKSPATVSDNPTTDSDKQIVISDGIKKHTCEYCGLRFPRAGNLTTHKRIHTGEKPYSCKECGKSFSRPALWKSHQVEHAKQEEHVCQKCGETFNGAEDLSEHIKTHSVERPFKCTICPKAFTTSSLQRRHVLLHPPVRIHACEFCGKRFNRSFNLKVHRKTHAGETPDT